jgi:hypothetical protein
VRIDPGGPETEGSADPPKLRGSNRHERAGWSTANPYTLRHSAFGDEPWEAIDHKRDPHWACLVLSAAAVACSGVPTLPTGSAPGLITAPEPGPYLGGSAES